MCALLGCALLGSVRPALAQSPVQLSGLAYVDYYYRITSPAAATEGLNGFTYRRLYLTADGKISDAFSARARLEAADSNLGGKGPEPFVKDLYLNWNVGGGHSLRMGVTSPPAFEISEKVWGYRSLEKTIVDLNKVVSSREFGIRANGPLAGDQVRYGLMVGNNEGVFPEEDKYKRVYGQLEFYPSANVTAALSANWAGYSGDRENDIAALALLGYVTDTWRIGVEGFYELNTFERLDSATSFGASLFGDYWFSDGWGLVGRVDRVQRERGVFSDEPETISSLIQNDATLGLAAVVYRPHAQVQLMPNVLVTKDDSQDTADLQGRFTLFFEF